MGRAWKRLFLIVLKLHTHTHTHTHTQAHTESNKSLKSLSPCSRLRLEKLTGSQLVKKFPTFYGTQMFNTALTTARQLSLL